MRRKVETVELRAVKIAARIMRAAGMCRFDTVTQCHRVFVDEAVCDTCIKSWLLAQANRELKREGKR